MENHKEDILKKFLQDTFSDYEPEPSEASWENIFSAIQPNQPTFWGKSKPWIASVLVVLTGAWLWYGSTKVEATHGEIALNNNERVGRIALVNGKLSNDSQTDKTNQLMSNTEVVLQKDDFRKSPNKSFSPLLEFLPTKSASDLLVKTPTKAGSGRVGTLVTDEKTPTKAGEITKYSKEIIVKNDAPKEEEENHPTVEKQSDEAVVSTDNLTASTSGQMETLATGIAGTGNSIIEQVRYIHSMESLRNKDFTLAKIALSSPVITPLITPNREAKPVRQHTYLSMSITPIQTYRILTINNHSIQNVQISNLFNSERNGWQFDLGMIKPIGKLWNFRANLSYLKMRQWSEYQIGTDELILRNNNNSSSNSYPSQSSSNTVEVVGQTVTESKNLHMVGLKIDVQKFFKITAKNRYFISTGTQVMYENSQKQSNIFLNVSAGFQHIVSKTTFLTIEPIASYSLNNFNDSRSLLQANGYNLGLKMGVSFKVK
jgi:hypothetical protein